MTASTQMFLIVCPLVFLSGFMDAMAGGGGLISLPAYLIAGLPPHMALATNKLSSCIGTTSSVLYYIKNGYVNMKIAAACIPFAIAGSVIGTKLVLLVSDKWIKYFLLVALPVVAVFVLRKKDTAMEEEKCISMKRQVLLAVISAFAIGMYDGFYGPGCGTFFLLIFTALCGLSMKQASGTVKIVNWTTNITSCVVFLFAGAPMIPLGLTAGFCGLCGHFLGARMVVNKGMKVVKPVIIVVLCLLFIKVIIGLFE